MSTKARRRCTSTLALGLCLLALGACQPYLGGPPGAPQVALWGDSITSDATPALRRAFERDFATATWSFPGIVVGQAFEETRSQIEFDPPDAFVIELGINNTKDGDVDLEDRAELLRMADLVRPSGCVVWVNAATTRVGLMPLVAELNGMLTALSQERPWVRIADWNRVAMTHGEWFRDGVHHTPEGDAAYVPWLEGEVERICGL